MLRRHRRRNAAPPATVAVIGLAWRPPWGEDTFARVWSHIDVPLDRHPTEYPALIDEALATLCQRSIAAGHGWLEGSNHVAVVLDRAADPDTEAAIYSAVASHLPPDTPLHWRTIA